MINQLIFQRSIKLLISTIFVASSFWVFSVGCSSKKRQNEINSQAVAIAWADLSLHIAKSTPANSPTFASRGFGYIGLTMYETVVHGFPKYNSLAGQLNGLFKLPVPETNKKYNWVLALNAGQAYILKNVYNQTSDYNKIKIDSLEQVFFKYFSENTSNEETIQRSIAFGKAIASAIFEWSKLDGGHRAYLRNFDKSIKFSTSPGFWEPPLYGQSFSHFPLHPHWGENRTFLKQNDELKTPKMLPFDTSKMSDYYNQFKKVYNKSLMLTRAEKEAALWWSDDPNDTFTPPGHSFYIATIILKLKKADLITCVATYAHIGIALADAFIICWKSKYHYWSERPSSFITKYIDPHWESFWPDPPFPAFPSGHATQAGAVATVMSKLFGNRFMFIDSAHVGKRKDELRNVEFKPRKFHSFWEVALETANSRFYGGIHTPQDNDSGLAEGSKIGINVIGLKWKNE